MSTYFLDTSALVKRYHREEGSDILDRLFEEPDAKFIISDISIIEFYSAIALKVRTGEIDEANFASLRKLFSQDIKKGIYEIAEFTKREKAESVKILVKYGKKYSLKTLDAIQISIMKSIERSMIKAIVCADENLCRVIALEGFQVINPMNSGS